MSARLAVLFMTDVVSQNDGFSAAPSVPSITIFNCICWSFYGQPEGVLVCNRIDRATTPLSSNLSPEIPLVPACDFSLMPHRALPFLARLLGERPKPSKPIGKRHSECLFRPVDALHVRTRRYLTDSLPLRVERNGSAAVEELSDVADAHRSGALSGAPGRGPGVTGLISGYDLNA